MKEKSLSGIFLLMYIIAYLLRMKIFYANYILFILLFLYLIFSLKKIKFTRNCLIILSIFSFSYLIPSMLYGNIDLGIKNFIQIIISLSPVLIYLIETNNVGKKSNKIIYGNISEYKNLIYILFVYIFVINYIYLSSNPYFARIMANYNYNIPGMNIFALFSGGGYFIIYGIIFLSILFLNNMLKEKRIFYKILNLLLYSLCGMLIFKANFATAFILYFLGSVLYIFIRNHKKMKFINVVLLIVFIICIFNYVSIFSYISNFFPEDSIIYIRINDAINNTEVSTLNERFSLMNQSIETIKKNLLFGRSHFYGYNYDLMRLEMGLHTEWIDVIAKYGIITFCLYIFLIYICFKSLIAKFKGSDNYYVFISSAILLLIMGFLNPIANTSCLCIIFQIIPLFLSTNNS